MCVYTWCLCVDECAHMCAHACVYPCVCIYTCPCVCVLSACSSQETVLNFWLQSLSTSFVITWFLKDPLRPHYLGYPESHRICLLLLNTGILSVLFVIPCYDKTLIQSNLWHNGFISVYSLQSIMKTNRNRNLRTEAESKDECCLLACSSCLAQP